MSDITSCVCVCVFLEDILWNLMRLAGRGGEQFDLSLRDVPDLFGDPARLSHVLSG